MTIDEVLSALDGVRPVGPGKWVARCPAHDDRHPSLSVAEANGRVLLHCFAGCSYRDILSALGLGRDVGHAPRPAPRPTPKPKPPERQPLLAPHELRGFLLASWRFLGSPRGQPGRDYLAARGLDVDAARACGVGYCPPTCWPHTRGQGEGRIVIPMWRREGGVWAPCNAAGRAVVPVADGLRYTYLPGHERGVFLSPSPAAAPEAWAAPETLWVVEGPMDALALAAAGAPAVVAVGGSSGLRLGDFPGVKTVILALDQDRAGREAARKMAAACAAGVRCLRANWRGGKDVAEALARTGSLALPPVPPPGECSRGADPLEALRAALSPLPRRTAAPPAPDLATSTPPQDCPAGDCLLPAPDCAECLIHGAVGVAACAAPEEPGWPHLLVGGRVVGPGDRVAGGGMVSWDGREWYILRDGRRTPVRPGDVLTLVGGVRGVVLPGSLPHPDRQPPAPVEPGPPDTSGWPAPGGANDPLLPNW